MTHDELLTSLKARNFFKLSSAQWQIFSVLVMREQVQKKQIYDMLWPDPDLEPSCSAQIIRLHVWRIKKRIAKFDITITGVQGHGYFMSMFDRTKAIELAKTAMES